jgi:hypothetical protein
MLSSEMQYDSGGNSNITLGGAEESSLQGVALYPPADTRDQVVVDTTAQGISKRRAGDRGIGDVFPNTNLLLTVIQKYY